MRSLMELVDLDRRQDVGNKPPPPRPKNPSWKEEPREGKFWLNGPSLIAASGEVNEVVSLAGQTVLLHPEKFGLTAEWILSFLKLHRDGSASEYERYLNDPSIDVTRIAYLWRSSKIMFEEMLKRGWAWVYYRQPETIHITVIPSEAKEQLHAAADHFPLLTIDEIIVTLVKSFKILDRFPAQSYNRSLVFKKNQIGGFSGAFGGAVTWANGNSEAPDNNFLYFYTRHPQDHIGAEQKSVMTPEGSRKRWGITFYAEKAPIADKSAILGRVPVSAFYSINCNKNWLRGISPVNKRGQVTMYSDRVFYIHDVEYFIDGKWTNLR